MQHSTAPSPRRLAVAATLALCPLASGCSPQDGLADAAALRAAAAPESERVELATARRVAVFPGDAFQHIGDVTPDGSRILVSHNANGQLALAHLESGEIEWLTESAEPWHPTWVLESEVAPDGRRVAYHEFHNDNEWTARVLDLATGESAVLEAPGDSYWHPVSDFHPDGRHALVQAAGRGEAWVEEYDLATGEHTRLVSGAGGDVRYTPDGAWIVYQEMVAPEGIGDTRLLRRDLTRDTPLEGLPEGAEVVGFSSDGGWVLFTRERAGAPALYRKAFDGTTATGEAVLVQADRWRSRDIGLDRLGRLFYSVNTSSITVRSVPLGGDGQPEEAPSAHPSTEDARRLTLSPDGKTFFYFRGAQPGGAAGRKLVVESVSGGASAELDLGVPILYPSFARWTPDGAALILKVVDTNDRYAFYRYDIATASVDTLRVWNGRENVGTLDVTPDGRRVVFAVQEVTPTPDLEGTPWRLDYLDLRTLEEGTVAHPLHSGDRVNMPDVSPDGSLVAFVHGDGIAVAPMSGGEPRVLYRHPGINFRVTPAWHPDGSALYFQQPREDGESVDLMRLDTHAEEVEPTGITMDGIREIDVHPDGSRLSFTAPAWGDEEIWRLDGVFPPAAPRTDAGSSEVPGQ